MRDAVAVALAVVRKLQPEMSRDHALDEIAGVIRECLTHIEKDVRVTIRVSPAHIDSIRHFANQAAESTGFEGKLVYAADPRIAFGDCRVEWGDGGAERDQARLWDEVDSVVARALGNELPASVAEENLTVTDGEAGRV
jgi:flagellar assembly protein FliH